MAQVHLRGVKKSYDKLEVIHGIDIEIAHGEFIVIVGPSGCGKSTLLRMVAGLERITGGEVAIGDRVVNELEPKDRDIAMVFQNYALYPHMSVFENMAFGLKLAKADKAEIDRRVGDVAKMLGLEPYLEVRAGALPFGAQRRTEIARCLISAPRLLLLDEPSAGMDAQGGIWLVFRGSEGKGTGQQQVRGSELAELIDAVRSLRPDISIILATGFAAETITRAPGLKRLNKSRVLVDTPQVRDMVAKVAHLVSVATVEG